MAVRPEAIAEGVYRLSVRGSNVYFVRSGSSWVLIDAAWANTGRVIVEAAGSLFGANTRPAAILLTHAHPDHSGSTLELARKWDIPVYVHPRELPVAPEELLAAEEYPAGPLDRWVVLPLMRILPARAREAARAQGIRFLAVARTFEPGAAVPGLPEWECIPTPGHSPGHVAFFRRRDRVLISGDALLTVNLNSLWDLLRNKRRVSGPPYISSWNWQAAKESVAALAELEPHVLAPGHGAPIADDVARAVRAFAESFAGAGAVEGELRATEELPAGSSLPTRMLFAADAFTALTATSGGIALAAGLEGGRLPRRLLKGTPFSSYVVPGLMLAGTVGGSSTLAALAMLRNPEIGARASVAAGGITMGWIAGEVLVLDRREARSWVEALYFAIGLTMAGLGLRLATRHAQQRRRSLPTSEHVATGQARRTLWHRGASMLRRHQRGGTAGGTTPVADARSGWSRPI